MFTHQTILLLRPGLPGTGLSLPLRGHFRDYHFAQTVMEVKRHLLRSLQKLRPEAATQPDVILVDAGANNRDIKLELERWMENHAPLRRIKVSFPPPRPWVSRAWKGAQSWMSQLLNHSFTSPKRVAP